jgi:hypothetical protein
MPSRRSGLRHARTTLLALGLTVSLGAGLAQAHDPRLDEALLALAKAEGLVEAAQSTGGELPPAAEKKYERRLDRIHAIIERAMAQIEAAADLADDALDNP